MRAVDRGNHLVPRNRYRATWHRYCVIETPLKKIYVYDSVLQLSGPHKKATKTGESSTTSDKPERIDNDASLAVVQ